MNLTINVFNPLSNATPPWVQVSPAASLDAGGISIGGDANGSNSNTHTATVTDNSTVTVTVTQDGFYPYSMDFNVWEEDLSLAIVLIPKITDAGNPYFNMGFPGFEYVSVLVVV